jgi:hypothetical protein
MKYVAPKVITELKRLILALAEISSAVQRGHYRQQTRINPWARPDAEPALRIAKNVES